MMSEVYVFCKLKIPGKSFYLSNLGMTAMWLARLGQLILWTGELIALQSNPPKDLPRDKKINYIA